MNHIVCTDLTYLDKHELFIVDNKIQIIRSLKKKQTSENAEFLLSFKHSRHRFQWLHSEVLVALASRLKILGTFHPEWREISNLQSHPVQEVVEVAEVGAT